MAAEIDWHRYGTKVRHCHPVYRLLFYFCRAALLSNDPDDLITRWQVLFWREGGRRGGAHGRRDGLVLLPRVRGGA